MCTIHIGKTVGDIDVGFISRMEKHILECTDGISSFKFPIHLKCLNSNFQVSHCSTQNSNLMEPFSAVIIMINWNPQKLDFHEKYLHQKGYASLNSSIHFSKNVSLQTNNDNGNKVNDVSMVNFKSECSIF